MTAKIETPEGLQRQAIEYFRSLAAPKKVTVEVWEVDTDSGVSCSSYCHRIGFVLIGDSCYCVPHASSLIANLRVARHVDIDIARPILVPDELTATEDLLELIRNFLYFVADHKGSTVTGFMYERATSLGNRCDAALKVRRS